MARFEHSRGRDRNDRSSRRDAPRRDSRRRDDSGRDSNRYSRDSNRGPQTTEVICSSCGIECDVPFKPTSNKPVYCRKCFEENNEKHAKPNYRNSSSNTDSNSISNRDLDVINEKLNKIMKALKIE